MISYIERRIQAIQTSTTAKSKEKATQVNNALNGVLILVKDSFY